MNDDEAFDPWKTSIHGIKIMSPAEDAMWRRFEHFMRERDGWGWHIELDTSPTPREREMLSAMEKIGCQCAQSITDLALSILTGNE